MNTFRIAVTGGRDHRLTEDEIAQLCGVLLDSASSGGGDRYIVLLHGNCRGVDQEAARLAESWGFPVVPFEAPWSWFSQAGPAPQYEQNQRLGRGVAGPLRNWMMLRAADLLLAFPGGRGTANCVKQARELGVEVVEVGR